MKKHHKFLLKKYLSKHILKYLQFRFFFFHFIHKKPTPREFLNSLGFSHFFKMMRVIPPTVEVQKNDSTMECDAVVGNIASVSTD